MELPVVIEPLPEKRGFAAHLGSLFHLAAEAATVEEAHQRLAEMLQQRLQEGLTLRSISIPAAGPHSAEPGWLPDDELTRDWLEQVQKYRAACDEEDRNRIADELDSTEESA